MRRIIDIQLGENGTPLGTLRYDQQGARESAAFEYGARWLVDAERFAIEPGLPLVAGPQFHRKTGSSSVFHAVLADTEPDGWGKRVIQRDHAKRRQQARREGEAVAARPLTSMDYLLAVDDVSRVGAIRLLDEDGRYQRTVDGGRPTTPPLIDLAQLLTATRAVETNTETAADLAYLRGRGTSLGGLRPKCSVLDEDGWLAIGKFPSVSDERPVTKGEVLAMRLARKAGIGAADARIVDSDDSPVALIRRFDRTANGARLMYVSAADIEELWRRIAFSILITNVDDHLLNHGFLHVDRGQWRLAPAFDINPFPERVRELKTWVSEETGPEATIDALMSVIANFRITPDRAKTMLAEIEAAVASWREEGRLLGMTVRELDTFTEAFEHQERAAVRRAMT